MEGWREKAGKGSGGGGETKTGIHEHIWKFLGIWKTKQEGGCTLKLPLLPLLSLHPDCSPFEPKQFFEQKVDKSSLT